MSIEPKRSIATPKLEKNKEVKNTIMSSDCYETSEKTEDTLPKHNASVGDDVGSGDGGTDEFDAIKKQQPTNEISLNTIVLAVNGTT